jgi:ABC-type spermidine/putrescine transport system permease subunit II
MAGEASDIVARHGRLARGALTGWAVFIYFFLFAPLVVLVLFSFNANPYGTLPITGWTLHWYSDAYTDPLVRQAVQTTLQVAAEVTILSTVIGTAAAFPLVRSHLRFRSAVRAAMTLPIMLPGLLIGVSLLTFFTSTLHLALSNQTVVIGQTVYTTPFVILVVASRLEGFDRSLETAASDLGANTWQSLRYVVLPLIWPAIFAGAVFAFTLSLDEFVITYFLIGAGNTLPIYIYTQVKFGITPAVNAIATVLISASLTILALGFVIPLAIRGARRRLRGHQSVLRTARES